MAPENLSFAAFELDGWQRVSAHYGDSFGPLTTQAMEPLLSLLEVRGGSRFLDVATGPGFLAAAARLRGAEVTGIDFSAEMIALARKASPQLRFEVGDAESLSFPTDSFDVVAMNFGILHLARPEVAIQEAARVLSKGGRFAFSCWDLPEQRCGFRTVLKAIEAHGAKEVMLPSGPAFFQFSDPNHALPLLHSNGFAEPTVTKLPLLWKLPSAESFFDAFYHGTPRTGGLLRAQPPANLAEIRRDIVESAAAEFGQGQGSLAIPMPAIVYGAKRAYTRV